MSTFRSIPTQSQNIGCVTSRSPTKSWQTMQSQTCVAVPVQHRHRHHLHHLWHDYLHLLLHFFATLCWHYSASDDAIWEDGKQYSCYNGMLRWWNSSKSKVAKAKDQHKTTESTQWKSTTSFKSQMCALKFMLTYCCRHYKLAYERHGSSRSGTRNESAKRFEPSQA